MPMRTSIVESGTGTKVDAGDAANQATRVTGAQPNANPPPITPGVFIPFQADPFGNLRTDDAEQVRNRASLEEVRMLTEATEYLLLRGRAYHAEVWTPFVDRRGGSGQRGTIR